MVAILGISAFYHDSAAALLIDGEIVAAAQEERFSRKKHDERFPAQAIAYCLDQAGLSPDKLDYVGFYDKPLRTFDRLLETYLAFAPRGFSSFLKAMPEWLGRKLHLPRELRKGLPGYTRRFIFTEHHQSHAASAFFPSPFDEAAILTLDGVGEWATTSLGHGTGNRIELTRELHFPHSVGLLYSAFTYYCGFKVNSGEYKLMGLAPYGQPTYVDRILDKLLDLKDDGSFRMDMSYFNYCQGLTMTSEKFHNLFGGPPREPESRITQEHMDIAASVQKVTEEIMLRCARYAHEVTGSKNLCLAGGVALNCVGNGRILREGPFDKIWIQPAAGDAGGALGVALFTWHQLLDNPRQASSGDSQHGSLLGPMIETDDEIREFLEANNVAYEHIGDDGALCEKTAQAIADGKVIGWFQGRMEFGPRALGSRSIIGDARQARMQSIINQKVKFREGFRPFAPIVLAEHAHEYFGLTADHDSPYMLLVAPVNDDKRLEIPAELADVQGIDKLKRKLSVIPAVTHVDYSARVQTVDAQRHGLLRVMMERFYDLTGCPVLVNTSFNLGWEPIVRSLKNAHDTFMSCEIDMLVCGHFMIDKACQPVTVTASPAASAGDDPVLSAIVCSPCCEADLRVVGDEMVCSACEAVYSITDGVPRLCAADTDLAAHRAKEPAPDYSAHDSVRSLAEASRKHAYLRRLDETLPYNSRILEIGCGTGHLVNLLGISCRQVIGIDGCLSSLSMASRFRVQHGLARVRFVQMNPIKPAFRPESFDVVLHSRGFVRGEKSADGFQAASSLVRPGGYLVIAVQGGQGALGARAGETFPRSASHVLNWLDNAGLEFIRGVPAMRPDDDGLAGVNLFEPQPRGSAFERSVAQAMHSISSGPAGDGLFVLIARKPGDARAASLPAQPAGTSATASETTSSAPAGAA